MEKFSLDSFDKDHREDIDLDEIGHVEHFLTKLKSDTPAEGYASEFLFDTLLASLLNGSLRNREDLARKVVLALGTLHSDRIGKQLDRCADMVLNDEPAALAWLRQAEVALRHAESAGEIRVNDAEALEVRIDELKSDLGFDANPK